MNDSERVKVADVIETELDSYCPSPFNGAFAVSLMQIIDRLLTDRAVPEPDAVERAAETLCDFHAENEGGWRWCDQNNGWDHHAGVGRDYYRAMARAALAAMEGSE